MKKLMSTCTALLLALCMLLPAYSAFAATDNDKIGQRLEKVASQTEGATNYLYKDKDFGVADAVDMLAAVRNYDASDAQVEGFKAAVEKELKANGGKLYYPVPVYDDNYAQIGTNNTEELELYAAVICVYDALGEDYTDVAGYDLSKLMQNSGTAVYGTNYYLYRLVTEACAIVDAPQSFVQSVIKNLTDLYKIGEGPDFWGGYGASADDLGAFLTALAPYADDYKTYIDDAVKLLEKNVSDAGYTSWGSANADSTAMALMAYSALDDQEKADKAYDLLCKFESKKTGVFTYDGEENLLATKDALTALGFKYMGMALIMAALASCSSDDDFGTNWQNDPTAVRVSATVGGVFTRSNPVATTEEDLRNFKENDVITISTEGQKSVDYKFNGSTWEAEKSGEYLKWSSEPMTFTARYPKGSGDFIVPINQYVIDTIASADYMTAEKSYAKIPDSRKVDFRFERQMARVVITIAGFNNEFSGEDKVSEMWVTSKERIAKDGSAVTATSAIIPYSQDRYGTKGSIYYALVAPNTATNYEFIKLRVKSRSDLKDLTVKNPVPLEAGKSYNFNLTIGKDGVSLGTVSVENWDHADNISGGEAVIDPIDLSNETNLIIADDGYYVITTNGKTTENNITISGNATVQLKNAIISRKGYGINVKKGSPTIIVSGTENSVTSTHYTAINVNKGATLTIKGKNGTTDKLTAIGGSQASTPVSSSTAGAGIGSDDGGNIVIENVSIEATGGTGTQDGNPTSGGAGIGSSSAACCGDITISNAVITASGGNGAPGIGMGVGERASAPTMGEIHIKFSTITATGGLYASAIGFPNSRYFDIPKNITGGTINIETEESSETFLSRLTCDLGTSSNLTIHKIGKGNQSGAIYRGLDGGEWPGVVLKASGKELTSTDGIGALKR